MSSASPVLPRPVPRDARGRSLASNLLLSLRPKQWTKNLLVFAGLIFSQRLFDPHSAGLALAAFAIFCGLSGVIYLVNDIRDRDADQRHPIKSRRPIASGALSPRAALTAAVVIGGVALAGAFRVNAGFGLVALAYVALLSLYSAALKHVVILDVLTLSGGFVLRALAGAVALQVEFSHWLLLLTLLLALFLALSKRRAELVALADGASAHRRILAEYSPICSIR